MLRLLVVSIACFFAGGEALACGLRGTVTRTDGSTVNRTATVSSSWNHQKAYPDGGQYRIDLGPSACGQSVEVYINGHSVGTVKVPASGDAVKNIVLKGSSDYPAVGSH